MVVVLVGVGCLGFVCIYFECVVFVDCVVNW